MKELAIHCTIYVQSPDGWNEDNLDFEADDVINDIQQASVTHGGWDFDWQIYDSEVRDV